MKPSREAYLESAKPEAVARMRASTADCDARLKRLRASLEPCPCCGSETADVDFSRRRAVTQYQYPVTCANCGVQAPSVDSWNRRTYATGAMTESQRARHVEDALQVSDLQGRLNHVLSLADRRKRALRSAELELLRLEAETRRSVEVPGTGHVPDPSERAELKRLQWVIRQCDEAASDVADPRRHRQRENPSRTAPVVESNAIDELHQLLWNIDAVARYRGDEHGVPDCVDNDGEPYQSEHLHQVLLGIDQAQER